MAEVHSKKEGMSSAYLEVKPVIHIGFLDFSLFPQYPEFYAAYRMLNTKNHHELTDKFTLRVVELNQIEKATEEDRRWKIDYWPPSSKPLHGRRLKC